MSIGTRKVNTHKPQFDLKVHVRDRKGNVVSANPYKLTIVNGVKEFERPPGSGYIYTEGGELLRKPKDGQAKPVEAKQEFSNEELKRQIESLQNQLDVKNKSEDEIHMTASEIEVDDILTVAAADADNSEEIALMEKAGAVEEAAKVRAASKAKQFLKPNFTK